MANTTKKDGKSSAVRSSVGEPAEVATAPEQQLRADQIAENPSVSTEGAQGDGVAADPGPDASIPALAEPDPADDGGGVPEDEDSGQEQSETSTLVGSTEVADPNPAEVEIFPLRTYQDAGELKRRNGPGYMVPRRHADALITRGLATRDKPEG
ncbi:hypothetical protein NJF54_20080 [Pseudomonas guariconensis]|uniref:hypothetical protein n=1 Tax=Pseudomonas guariconensis TaxID=1288410 RepID=UPI00209AF388|nr:hypothetical protein [Pseudomonas guariconensis]MCO7634124.1 hypothetical protein [Pseudomonas guariconensis]